MGVAPDAHEVVVGEAQRKGVEEMKGFQEVWPEQKERLHQKRHGM